MHDCSISLINYVPATSLETEKANAANASMLCQQNVKIMYFKTRNPIRFLSVVIQMLQIFNEFVWLVHVGILG